MLQNDRGGDLQDTSRRDVTDPYDCARGRRRDINSVCSMPETRTMRLPFGILLDGLVLARFDRCTTKMQKVSSVLSHKELQQCNI